MDLSTLLPLMIKASVLLTVLALSTTFRHPAVALAVAVAGGADSRSELAAILLYLIVATLVSIPYVMWRKRVATSPT